MDRLKCTTKAEVDAIGGTVYVKVDRPNSWAKAEPLTICATMKSDGVVGLVPMPNGGWLRTKTTMSIEVAELEATGAAPTGSDTQDNLPASQNWNWC